VEGSPVATNLELPRGVGTLRYDLFGIAQQFRFRNVFGKFRAQKTLVRCVLEQTANEISHSRQEFAHRAVFADAITHLDERTLDRAGHAIKQLELEPTSVDAELFRERLRVRDAPDIVRTERGAHE